MHEPLYRSVLLPPLPAKAKLYRHYFLLYPLAIESAHLKKYDLIVSSCCGYAKGVKRGENGVHVLIDGLGRLEG